MSDPMTVGVRAWQAPTRKPKRRRRGKRKPPEWTFVFDTETTTDAGQRLRVGCLRIVRGRELVQEALFYEHLSAQELSVLWEYAEQHELALISIDEFRDWFFHYAYRLQARIVGHNLPFDLSRIAVDWGAARRGKRRRGERRKETHDAFHGGHSLVIWPRKDGGGENRFRPRLRIKSLSRPAALIAFAGTTRDERAGKGWGPSWRGYFIDTMTLTNALAAKTLTLDGAAKLFRTEHRKLGDIEHGRPLKPGYIDYLRRDVLVTEELLWKLLEEYERHPIDLDPAEAYSPASIAKSYLEALGITPPAERSELTDEQIGCFAQAFYGGRAECRIRKQPVPVTYVDVRSMYPTVFTLLGLYRHLAAERISCEDATDDVRELVAGVSLDDLFDPGIWRRLDAVVEIEPDGEILPVRAKYGGATRSIGVNHLFADERYWYSLPEMLASVLLTGRVPRIKRAIRLVGHGGLDSLRGLKLRGEVAVDPFDQEPFKRVIEERHRIQSDPDLAEPERDALTGFLKTFANSGSYGIFAELNRHELRERRPVDVYSGQCFTSEVTSVEEPGRYCFMPFATLITGAARLILAMLERCVTDAGGSYVFCDTDSMAIVTNYGRRDHLLLDVRSDAIPVDEVDGIVDRFARLNPYDFRGGILKIEAENYGAVHRDRREPLYVLAISSKRYVLFNFPAEGSALMRKRSEHGLGTYQDPQADGLAEVLD